MTIDHAIERVQFCYPQIYYACHTRHARKRSNPAHLSHRDSEILVHLDRQTPLTLSRLARHMDLSASTLSEAVTKLQAFGFVSKAPRGGDRRHVAILLTQKGVEAVRLTSVLETGRLRTALARLSPADRRRAIDGLTRLASACRPLLDDTKHRRTKEGS